MKIIVFLLLTALVTAGQVFVAAPTDAITSHPSVAGAFVADSRHGGVPDRGGLHPSDLFRHPGFSSDRRFHGQDQQRFLGKEDYRFRGYDRYTFERGYRRYDLHGHRDLGVHDHRNLLDHDRHFFGDPRHFIPNRHPYLRGYVPGNSITACYRTGSVLVCYGG